MSKPGDRMTAISDIPGDDERRMLEAIECADVRCHKGWWGNGAVKRRLRQCETCLGTGLLWREVRDE